MEPNAIRIKKDCPLVSLTETITLATKYTKVVIPAEAGIASRTVGVCQKIPASAGMTVACLFRCQIDNLKITVG